MLDCKQDVSTPLLMKFQKEKLNFPDFPLGLVSFSVGQSYVKYLSDDKCFNV